MILRRFRRTASTNNPQTATWLLRALEKSRQPQPVSGLMKATGQNNVQVINALEFLYSREYIFSTSGEWARAEAATDKAGYSITRKGLDILVEDL